MLHRFIQCCVARFLVAGLVTLYATWSQGYLEVSIIVKLRMIFKTKTKRRSLAITAFWTALKLRYQYFLDLIIFKFVLISVLPSDLCLIV
jgi:hypothetical protein